MWEITAEELDAHAEWLKTDGKSGTQLNKTGRNLSAHSYPGIKADKALFIGTIFNDADLSNGSFICIDCSGARFERANLHQADLRGADLGGVILDGVDLSMADLSGADLSGATLKGANLTRTNFTDADLVGADLTDANQENMCLEGAKTTDAKGLTR